MPGLIRGVARTAVVAGTATAVSNRVSRRQGNRWAAQQQAAPQYQPAPQYQAPPQYQPAPQYQAPPQYQPPPPAAAAPPATDRIALLQSLADLKANGVLTDAEFEREKARILAS